MWPHYILVLSNHGTFGITRWSIWPHYLGMDLHIFGPTCVNSWPQLWDTGVSLSLWRTAWLPFLEYREKQQERTTLPGHREAREAGWISVRLQTRSSKPLGRELESVPSPSLYKKTKWTLHVSICTLCWPSTCIMDVAKNKECISCQQSRQNTVYE